ncbi:S8 family serine peptidase [Lentzea sp. E54]|uniref:S8 family serine peptidase n=1 Tax=Lentzea xerophila TaxID=3435883 RepID=UPI003DA4F598
MRIPVIAGIVGVLAATVVPVGHATDPAAASGAAHAVTLITGDRVVVDANGLPSVRPGPGREGMAFSTTRHDGHLTVMPADAIQLVASGRVDPRLFDVTALLGFSYDDAHRDTLPLIITQPDDEALPRVAGTSVVRDLPSINGTAMLGGKSDATALWEALTDGSGTRTTAAGVDKIWLDGLRRTTLDRSTAQIGAPAAWNAGHTGKGVKIAILDTGVDQTHPDLADREIAEKNFSDAPDNIDRYGHGTHVASIAAGTGARSGGKYRGVAHEGSLLDGKVLNDNGSGQESWIVAGMQWAAEQGAAIVNLSLGAQDTPGTDPLEQAVDTLSRQHGTLFVIAAGNTGTDGSISSPGSADAALTVGAVDRSDGLAPFSSRGPRLSDGAIKPDITAPGVGIAAALHSAGTIGQPVEPGYVALSGTSMATPHVAGAAALLAQQHPDWTGARLKAALTGSAKPGPGLTPFAQGSGRVELPAAITGTVYTEPTGLGYGIVPWPHDDDRPITKSLTYHNSGDAAATLDLTVEGIGPDGKPADGVFSVSEKQITVPAGGTAKVNVVADTSAGTLDGIYSGAVLATAGASSTRVPVAVDREKETYDLKITFLDEGGKPTSAYVAKLLGLDDNSLVKLPYAEDGSIELRLPKGRYALDNLVAGQGRLHLVAYPNLELTKNTTITVDTRTTKPISVTPPGPATFLMADVGYSLRTATGRLSSTILVLAGGNPSQASLGHLGPPSPPETLTGIANTAWTAPEDAFYGLAWFPESVVPAGFTRKVAKKELATVHARFGAPVPGRFGWRSQIPMTTDGTFLSPGSGREVPLPGAATEYVNTDGVRWAGVLTQWSSKPHTYPSDMTFNGPLRTYRAGREYSERFNHGVFGPAFPPLGKNTWADRRGNVLEVFLPLFGDSAGNGGLPGVGAGSIKLYRGEKLIGESSEQLGYGLFRLPPEKSEYRMTTSVSRPAVLDVSTVVTAEWTFRSGHVAGAESKEIPLCAIRFTPELDDTTSAPAGRPFRIPVALQCSDGSRQRARDLTVDVSYDEGKTWRPADVRANRTVKVDHPADATSVSLRASAADGRGNTIRHTIIRAYKLA